jgi:haloalkane dehalogenase
MEIPTWLDRRAYPFAARTVRTRAGRLHYLDEGSGPPILFVHGTPTWSFEFRHLVAALAPAHRCVAIDLPGFGLSERPADFPYTVDAHAEALAEAVDNIGLADFALVAHDYGGPIALPLALDRPGLVRRLALLNTWMWPFDDDPHMRRAARITQGAFGRFLYRRLNFALRVLTPYAYGDRKKLTREIHRHYLGPFPDARSRGLVLWPMARAILGGGAFYADLWRRRERRREIPSLLVWGTADRAFPASMIARWREALPRVRVVTLDGVGHWPHEEAPDEVAGALRAFLS